MNIKKIVLSLVTIILLLPFTTGVAAGNGVIEPYPACGKHTVSFINDIYPAHHDENIQLDSELIEGVQYLSIVSLHGWEIVEVDLLLAAGGTDEFNFPHVTKALILPPGVPLLDMLIFLEKECPSCRPTGRFVYTLFGNFPCNLIAEDNSIPARFLNPEYTGPLCNLPTVDHEWNGDWVKNREFNCGGYFVGGNHYDTRLENLP